LGKVIKHNDRKGRRGADLGYSWGSTASFQGGQRVMAVKGMELRRDLAVLKGNQREKIEEQGKALPFSMEGTMRTLAANRASWIWKDHSPPEGQRHPQIEEGVVCERKTTKEHLARRHLGRKVHVLKRVGGEGRLVSRRKETVLGGGSFGGGNQTG